MIKTSSTGNKLYIIFKPRYMYLYLYTYMYINLSNM